MRGLTPEQIGASIIPFPGNFLRLGSTGEDVVLLQELINTASTVYASIPEIPVTGVFDEATRDAVYAVEETFGYPTNGIVGAIVWNELANIYSDVESGASRADGQFSGRELQKGGEDR